MPSQAQLFNFATYKSVKKLYTCITLFWILLRFGDPNLLGLGDLWS